MVDRSLVRKQSTNLLESILDNPQLPALVARLDAPALNRLIEHVGPEDAGPLLVYTTSRQLRQIFDDSIWANLAPGHNEVHRPEEFIRWLFVLLDQGEAFFAERLASLGMEYAVLNFAQLVEVNDGEAILSDDYHVLEHYGGEAAYAEEFGGYYVTAIHDEEWDITRSAFVALQSEVPSFFEQLLFRMNRGDGALLMHDVSGDRRDAKESAGYVTPESARAFLALTQRTSLAELVVGPNHDPVSVRYFLQLGAFEADDDYGFVDSDSESASLREPQNTAGGARVGEDGLHQAEQLRELEVLLVEAEIITDRAANPLLTGPDASTQLPVKEALDGLQHTDPALFSERLSELVYLSNVLIAGTTIDEQRFDQVEAAHAALSACNLGMSYLGERRGDDQAMREGLVRLFRIGWQVMRQVPGHVAGELKATLASAEFSAAIFDRRWILEEVHATLDELTQNVGAKRFDDAKSNLVFLSLVLEEATCQALQAMVCDYPRFPLETVERYFDSMDDIDKVAQYVQSISSKQAAH